MLRTGICNSFGKYFSVWGRLLQPLLAPSLLVKKWETCCFFWNHNEKKKQMQGLHFFFLLQKREHGHIPVVSCSHEEAEEAALVLAQDVQPVKKSLGHSSPPAHSCSTRCLVSWSPLPRHGTALTGRGSKPSPSRLAPRLAIRAPCWETWVWAFSQRGINQKLDNTPHGRCLWGVWLCRSISGKVCKPRSAHFPEQSLPYRGARSCVGPDLGPHSMKSKRTSRTRAQWRFPGLLKSFKSSGTWKPCLH